VAPSRPAGRFNRMIPVQRSRVCARLCVRAWVCVCACLAGSSTLACSTATSARRKAFGALRLRAVVITSSSRTFGCTPACRAVSVRLLTRTSQTECAVSRSAGSQRRQGQRKCMQLRDSARSRRARGCRRRLAEHLCVRVRALACARVCLRLYVHEHACVCSTATRAAGEFAAAVTHPRICECFGDPPEPRSVQLHAEYRMLCCGICRACAVLGTHVHEAPKWRLAAAGSEIVSVAPGREVPGHCGEFWIGLLQEG
jgi:hypothetical protein